MSFGRYFHTLRHLRFVQLYSRLTQKLSRPRPDLSPAPPLRQLVAEWTPAVCRTRSLLGPARFHFLNEGRDLRTPADWDAPEIAKLWRYNLHYFDDLTAVDARERERWHDALMHRWIVENPPARGTGWEPYPLSIRIVNWIKKALVGRSLSVSQTASLAVQSRFLAKKLEWHLLGNHLLANAKALVFAGLYFEGAEADGWLQTGLRILDGQLREQILADGGHFERSPMYHSLMLEDMLDLINLHAASGLPPPPTGSRCPPEWVVGWVP